ncbi:MAG: NAD(P)H-hydrate dehydratase [Ruminococcaceae bacterium]|nr:NAD(P)H-hydrate dehydratase [Oscillospiraceae bacterium]
MKLATAKQMRELDRCAIEELGIPSVELMEKAARGVAKAALELGGRKFRKRVSVFCGSGNNGGDGIAAARILLLRGARVRVFLVGQYEKLTSDSMEMTRRLSECGVELETYDPQAWEQREWVMESDVIIDAMLGVGLSREIAEESAVGAAIRLINEAPGAVVAADIATGVDADTGQILGTAVKADKTVTFSLAKVGQFVGKGKLYSGEVKVQEIGIPEELVKEVVSPVQTVDESFAGWALPKRTEDGHKGTFGKLLAVGGSVGYTGAPWLMAESAVRSGCGLVYLGVPESIWQVEAVKCVSSMPFPLPETDDSIENKKLNSETALHIIEEKLNACSVLALGPGMGRSQGAERLIREILQRAEKSVVLDADGINALRGHMDVLSARRDRVTILTPHDGEFAGILGRPVKEVVFGNRIQLAAEFAREYRCTLVLKGHRTITATPEGSVLINTTGNSGLAKGGSGDVLTGIIAALLCQGASPVQAAAGGVWIHGRAAELTAQRLTEYSMTPVDVMEGLAEVFCELQARSYAK